MVARMTRLLGYKQVLYAYALYRMRLTNAQCINAVHDFVEQLLDETSAPQDAYVIARMIRDAASDRDAAQIASLLKRAIERRKQPTVVQRVILRD